MLLAGWGAPGDKSREIGGWSLCHGLRLACFCGGLEVSI